MDSSRLSLEALLERERLEKLDRMTESELREGAKLAVVQAATRTGIPLHALMHPEWRSALEMVARCGRQVWQHPSYDAMRTTLFDQDFERTTKQVEDNLGPCNPHRPVAVVLDGCTNVNRSHMINIMLVQGAKGSKATFHSAFKTSTKTASGEHITEELSQVIEELGPEKVLQVVMDNAFNCKLAANLLQQKYPRLWFTPCQCYNLNVVATTWGRLLWFKNTIEKSKTIVTYVKTHPRLLEIYSAEIHLELPKTASSRFRTNYIMLERLQHAWISLRKAFSSQEMDHWERTQPTASREAAANCRSLLGEEALKAAVKQLVNICKPLWEAIRQLDSPAANMGHVFHEWRKLALAVRYVAGVSGENRKELAKIVRARAKKVYTDLIGAACLLEPVYWGYERGQRVQLQLEKSLKVVMKKFYPSKKDFDKCLSEWQQYWNLEGGFFGTPEFLSRLNKLKERPCPGSRPACQWSSVTVWSAMSLDAPMLSPMAQAILSQVASNPWSEKSWSSCKHIHGISCNKLGHETAEKLRFIYCNTRLWSGEGSDSVSERGAEEDLIPEASDAEESGDEYKELEEAETPSETEILEEEPPRVPASNREETGVPPVAASRKRVSSPVHAGRKQRAKTGRGSNR